MPKVLTQKENPSLLQIKFCSSYGKKASDIWIKTKFNTLPTTKWKHAIISPLLKEFNQGNMKLPVRNFIARLISHVLNKHFQNIRYHGFISNKIS